MSKVDEVKSIENNEDHSLYLRCAAKCVNATRKRTGEVDVIAATLLMKKTEPCSSLWHDDQINYVLDIIEMTDDDY